MTYLVAYELPTEHHPSLLLGLGFRVYWLAFLGYITHSSVLKCIFVGDFLRTPHLVLTPLVGIYLTPLVVGKIPDTAAGG